MALIPPTQADRKKKPMIKRFLLLFLLGVFIISCSFADGRITLVPDEEWSWAPGAYNTVSGEVDLSEFAGKEIKLKISADIPDTGEEGSGGHPVFSVINGQRITVLNQSDSVTLTPDAASPGTGFVATIVLPEKQHLRRITFTIEVLDQDENRLRIETGEVSSIGKAAGASAFYIPYDAGGIALYAAALAAVIWLLAIIRILIQNKKHTGA